MDNCTLTDLLPRGWKGTLFLWLVIYFSYCQPNCPPKRYQSSQKKQFFAIGFWFNHQRDGGGWWIEAACLLMDGLWRTHFNACPQIPIDLYYGLYWCPMKWNSGLLLDQVLKFIACPSRLSTWLAFSLHCHLVLTTLKYLINANLENGLTCMYYYSTGKNDITCALSGGYVIIGCPLSVCFLVSEQRNSKIYWCIFFTFSLIVYIWLSKSWLNCGNINLLLPTLRAS